VLGNHDDHRLVTRLGHARARVAAVIALTLPGTVSLYYGDELGLPDNPRRPDVPRDGFARRNIALSRDPARAPMPWDGSHHGGFSAGEPWLPVYADAGAIGVARQREDQVSFLALYRRLLRLRQLGWGRARVTTPEASDSELIYDLDVDGRRYRVIARIDDGASTMPLAVPARVLLSARQPVPEGPALADAVTLAGPDAAVVELATG
jgi:alpha-glucosidase